MKICVEDHNKVRAGKHKFLSRLVRCLKKNGVEIVNNNSDILLHIGKDYENMKKINAKKIIMRMDGHITKSSHNKDSDKELFRFINESDAIIHQGYYCKNAYEKFFNISKKNVCIRNGADPNNFLKRDVKNYYFTCCQWTPFKRLENMCEGFIYACDNGLDSILYVGGNVDNKDKINHPQIKYLGWLSTKEMKEYFAGAIAFIHLSWLDWCPNAMVESIVAGCPVIYSDSGGSSEIGKYGGIPIEDIQWDYKPIEVNKIFKLDLEEISNALLYVKNNNIEVNGSDLYIEKIAMEYISFFKEVLK